MQAYAHMAQECQVSSCTEPACVGVLYFYIHHLYSLQVVGMRTIHVCVRAATEPMHMVMCIIIHLSRVMKPEQCTALSIPLMHPPRLCDDSVIRNEYDYTMMNIISVAAESV